MGKNTLICHILNDDLTEAGHVKARKYNQEFVWRKRMYPIKDEIGDTFITDIKGRKHLYVNVNESDGTYHWLTPTKLNLVKPSLDGAIDKCGECGGSISIDAHNVWDMLKRKTIDTFWGLDNTFTLLLIIMGIVAIGAMGFAFYLFGQNNTLNNQLTALRTQIEIIQPSAELIIGANMI